MKYQTVYDNGMHIRELSDRVLSYQSEYEKKRNTFDSCSLHDTLENALKYLGSYSKPVSLPDGSSAIPLDVNYPSLYSPFITVTFPVSELWPGEY